MVKRAPRRTGWVREQGRLTGGGSLGRKLFSRIESRGFPGLFSALARGAASRAFGSVGAAENKPSEPE